MSKVSFNSTSSPNKRSLVAAAIMNKIRDGELAEGERLATVRELCAAFSVSISVVQNALKDLCNNGFIECRGSNGYYVADCSKPSPKPESYNESGARIHVFLGHHSDLLWLHNLEGYRKIRDEQLLSLFDYASKYPSCAFLLEQAHIARVFFNDHPEFLPAARQLLKEGRLDLCGAYSIPDLNMVSGESIIRNLEEGRLVYKELFDAEPHFIRMADAFGMCAQLPQILLHCGQNRLMPGRTSNAPANLQQSPLFRWHSLSGNGSVMVFNSSASITHLGYSGNVPLRQSWESRLVKNVNACQSLSGNPLVGYETEETCLQEAIFPIIAQANISGKKQLVFSSINSWLKQFEHDDQNLLDYTGEFNPTFTGCYTTRIGIKQRIREAEYRLMLLELLNVLNDGKELYREEWRLLCLAQFHDGACGCHSDEAWEDVDAALSTATPALPVGKGTGFTVVSCNGVTGKQPVVSDFTPAGIAAQLDDNGKCHFLAELPQCGTRFFKTAAKKAAPGKKASPSFENQWLKVDFDGAFPVIFSKVGNNPFKPESFGEIVIRRDSGSMWTENFWDFWRGREYQSEKLISSTDGPVFHQFVTEGEFLPDYAPIDYLGNHWPGFVSLKYRKTYRFYHELDYFTLDLSVDWQGYNAKIAIRFPTGISPQHSTAVYDTPFAAIARKPYFEVPEEYSASFKPLASDNDYTYAKGDWPALNWVRYTDYRSALTVANTGTPGHQLTAGNIIISLLRSGTKTEDGGITPPPGALDNGTHHFQFAFCAHAAADTAASHRIGNLLNRKAVTIPGELPESSLLEWNSTAFDISTLRKTADGKLIARFYETGGNTAALKLSGKLADGKSLLPANAFGEPLKSADNGMIFNPMEIRTFILEQKKTKQSEN